jgi:hypothetical protein
LVPSETTETGVEQYQPITNIYIPMWAIMLYNRFTADWNRLEALVSETILKPINRQHEMPQLVDISVSMIRKQNTCCNLLTKGVETLGHNVYVQYTEIILN